MAKSIAYCCTIAQTSKVFILFLWNYNTAFINYSFLNFKDRRIINRITNEYSSYCNRKNVFCVKTKFKKL